MERLTATEVIERLGLLPLPGEGGYFRETYRSSVASEIAGRASATAIYYLLTAETYSALHRLRCDEVYFFHAGDPIEILLWRPGEDARVVVMSQQLMDGDVCQMVVPAGTWQGSRLLAGGRWGLVSTMVSPGFEFSDCELASAALLATWPASTRERAAELMPQNLR